MDGRQTEGTMHDTSKIRLGRATKERKKRGKCVVKTKYLAEHARKRKDKRKPKT